MARLIRLPALLTFEVGAVILLYWLASRHGFRVEWSREWLETSPVEEVLGGLLTLIALAIAYWLLFSTLAYVVASFSRRQVAIRATSWLTLPPIRRMVNRSVALSIAASSIGVPLGPAVADLAMASRDATVIVQVDPDGVVHPPGTEPPGEDDSGDGGEDVLLRPHLQSPQESPPDPVDVVDGALDLNASQVHIVIMGDHLWSIACQHLEAVSGRTDFGEHEIAPYWVKVIDANRSRIRSGDPDLIYPGEQIVLPPIE